MLAFVSEAAWLRETSPPASGFHLWPFGEHEGCWSFNSLLTPSSLGKLRPAWEGRAVGKPELSNDRRQGSSLPAPSLSLETTAVPGCSAVIGLTAGLAHPCLHPRLLPGPAQGCREQGPLTALGRTGTPGWGRACGGGDGLPGTVGSNGPWAGPAAGAPSVRYQAAGCHALVPAGVRSRTVPCMGASRHPALPHGEHPDEQTPCPSSGGRQGDRLTGFITSSTGEDPRTSQGEQFRGRRCPAGSQTPTPAVLPGRRGAGCRGQAGAKRGFVTQ